MKPRLVPRAVRARLFLAVLAAVALALTAGVIAFNVLLARTVSRDANNLVRVRTAAELSDLKTVNGRLVAPEAVHGVAPESQVWVFSGGRLLQAPRASSSLDRAVRELADGPERMVDLEEPDTRLYAVPVVREGRRLGTLVVGISLAPYDDTKHDALVGSLILAGSLLATVALITLWLLRRALRPVARMTADAEAWSERDVDRRFGLGEPYDELTRLATMLDRLLDRLAASLRREQRFSAELSHELRTPLARISAEAELALRRERDPSSYREALATILRSAEQMTRTVDALVAAERHGAGIARGTCDAYAAAASAAEACAGLAAGERIEIVIDRPSSPIQVGVEADVVERILQPVIENACRYGRDQVRVTFGRDGAGVLFTVEDDGPGVAPEEVERIFEPGARGSAAAGNGHGDLGAGLGLALARRLARAAAGELDVQALPGGGRFSVRLPAG